MLEKLLFDIKMLAQQRDAKWHEIKKYIQDKNYSLKDRWALFVEINKIKFIIIFDGLYFSPQSIKKEINWYDDFYLERNQTQSLVNFIEIIEEDISKDFTKEEILLLKEEILQNGYTHFLMDW